MNSARLVPAISAAFDWDSSPCEYQRSAAATRISFTNSVGDKRNAERAPSGKSNVIVGMDEPLNNRITRPKERGKRSARTLKRGAAAPRELLPIVSRFVSRRFKMWLRGRDLNPRPLGYEPNELPDCSTPRHSEEC